MTHIFISYKHDDVSNFFFDALQLRLERANYEWWKDDKLVAGTNWEVVIDEAIEKALAVLVIMTPEAQASQYVTYEWSYALGVGVPVIAIILKPVDKLHPKLAGLQYLDFTNEKQLPWDKLLQALEHASLTSEGAREIETRQLPDEQVMPRIQYGDNLYHNRDFANALETYSGALRVASESLLDDIHYRMALVYTARASRQRDNAKKRDDLVRAEPHLLKALELNEDYVEARAALGYLYRLMRDVVEDDIERTEYLNQAEVCFKKALTQRPDMTDENGESWWNTLGGVYKRRGQIDDAIGAYERAATEVKNNSSYPYSNLGTLYLEKANSAKVVENYRFVERYAPRALEKNPSDFWSRGDLLVAKLALGKTGDIDNIFNEYLLDAKDAPYAFRTLLETLEKLREVVGEAKREAIQTFINRLKEHLHENGE
ncbi:MAG: TIR domain-containing protein [Anaerolineaceae bacterium]|nr:TIR domain-containing protein [Anaerolineaceae bacterium]